MLRPSALKTENSMLRKMPVSSGFAGFEAQVLSFCATLSVFEVEEVKNEFLSNGNAFPCLKSKVHDRSHAWEG